MKSAVNPYVAVGITIGALAGVWTWVSISLGMLTWVAFLTWALFFAAGGKAAAIRAVLPAALTGVFYATVLLLTADTVGGGVILPVGVAVIAFFMCAQANWKTLAFIPGAFAGCAAVFGAAGDWLPVAVALVIGALLGWASEALAGLLTRPRAARVTAGAL